MSKIITPNQSRRAFLRRASVLSVAGAATPWLLNLASIADASAATSADYKAIVCVYLQGGNDYANTLVPYDLPNYSAYQKQRPLLCYPRSNLDSTVLSPSVMPRDTAGVAHQFALAPELSSLLPIFDGGKMAVLLNVGSLVQPVTKQQFLDKSVLLPAHLHSHNDQQSIWLSSSPEGAATGWGGRMGDLMMANNGNTTFSCVNVGGDAVFLSGNTAVQYQVASSGPVLLSGIGDSLFGSSDCSAALRTLSGQSSTHLMENDYARIVRRSVDANSVLTGALASATPLTTPFPATSLAAQLKMVARMISNSSAIGAKRQVFYVSLSGFDTHDGLLNEHPLLLKQVGEAIAAFYKATIELGVADKVTTFTASEFGRSLAGNMDGSDHGWGSMHFVVGGAVNGRQYYGTAPILADNGPDDIGQGRLIPTTSVDQYAATLGKWFGVSDTDLPMVLPNLNYYNASNRTLGFV